MPPQSVTSERPIFKKMGNNRAGIKSNALSLKQKFVYADTNLSQVCITY